MSEKGGFEHNQSRPEPEQMAPFYEQLRPEAEMRHNSLQDLSPDKRVYDVGNLSSLNDADRALLENSLHQAVEQWTKVVEPLRNVFNNWKRQEINGNNNANSERYARNYMAKVGEVLGDNMAQLSEELPFRVAVPVQSFAPDENGQMKAQMLYAFFPPKQTDIQERYVIMPLHSPDPEREAQLRGNPTLAGSISSHELEFRFKVGTDLLARRERPAYSA
jgi:hypothetical protein